MMAQGQKAPRDKGQGAAAAAANPFGLLGDADGEDGDDEEMAEAMQD